MATVTAFTSARSQAIEDEAIVSGAIVGDDLILTKNNATTVNAGDVRGPKGDKGDTGDVSVAQMDAAIALANSTQMIPTAQIEDLAVTAAKIANLGITAAKIADGTITLAKMAANSVGTSQIVDGAVTTAKIANGNVTGAKIGSKTVTGSNLADATVDTTQLAVDCVTAAKIANDAVGTEHVDFIFVQSSAPTGIAGGIWVDTST